MILVLVTKGILGFFIFYIINFKIDFLWLIVTRSLIKTNIMYLIDTSSGTHGGLNVEGLDVLPVLLEEGNEEVNT